MKILCVCLGNICRSPMAQGALERRLAEAGISAVVDSAGTGAYHIGNPPDPRGLAAASARGYDNSAQRARQVAASDFDAFDLILAMDASNLANLRRACPQSADCEIRLFDAEGRDIPDPYYGGPADYEHALDMIEAATEALVTKIASP
ncbi:MAG: low molecular weight protein-tyrosine-phosphatase [Pseudomonadota bacterium]